VTEIYTYIIFYFGADICFYLLRAHGMSQLKSVSRQSSCHCKKLHLKWHSDVYLHRLYCSSEGKGRIFTATTNALINESVLNKI